MRGRCPVIVMGLSQEHRNNCCFVSDLEPFPPQVSVDTWDPYTGLWKAMPDRARCSPWPSSNS